MTGTSSLTANATVVRRAVSTLDEGDVAIQFPADLSKESVEDLADYLETFMKRLRREAKPDEAAN
jgi:HAMP domain-containing protein